MTNPQAAGGQAPPTRRRRPLTVLIAAIMTYIGAGCMLLVGLMFLLGANGGGFLGTQTGQLGLAGASVPIEAAAAIGAIITVVGMALVVLAVLTQRGSNAARIGLTFIGAVFIVVQLYSAVTNDPVSSLIPLLWIAVAVTLLWAAGSTGFRGR